MAKNEELEKAPMKGPEFYGHSLEATPIAWEEIQSCKNPLTKASGSSPHEIQLDCEDDSK